MYLCTGKLKIRFMNTQLAAAPAVVMAAEAAITPASFLAGSEAVIKAYADSLANVVDSTKGTYTRALRAFFLFLSARPQQTAPTRSDVVAYKRYLLSCIDRGEYSALTVCSYLNAVRGFFDFAEAEGLYANIAKGIKSPKHTTQHKKQHLEADKVREFFAHYKEGGSPTALRDYAIANLLVRTGLRTAELVGANIGDIAFIGSTRVLWIKGKGHTEKDSYVQLTEKAYAPIREYLSTRPLARPSDPLFISTSNHRARVDEGEGTTARLSTRTIRNIAREGLDSIGLDSKAFTAHSLRHTTAVGILEAGGGLEDVQAQLRHASINTSRIYVESFNKAKQLSRISSALDTLF